MKKFLLLVVAGHCFACTFAMPLANKSVVITASLIHADSTTPRAMVLNFLNPFIKGRKSAAFNETNKLTVSEEMLFTQNMTIQYNNVFINLYVVPGDSVHLLIDGALLRRPDFAWLTISGDHAQLSKELNLWYDFGSRIPYKKYDLTVSPAAMLDTIRADYDRHKAILDEYAVQHSLNPIVRDWAANDLKYSISNWVSDYLTMSGTNNGELQQRIALFAQPFFNQYDAANFQSMMFPYHLASYGYALLNKDSSIRKAQRQSRYQDAANAGMKLMLQEPVGLARDYMLFNFLYGYISKSPLLLDSLPGIDKYFADPVSFDYLRKAAQLLTGTDFPETILAGVSYLNNNGTTQSLPSTDLFRYLVNQYAGKVLYIDVYATWCMPCLQEMTYAPAVKKQLAGKDVVFVNLCLQSDEDNWKKLVKEKKLQGENYLLPGDASKLFMGIYRFGGFPTYMLVNRQGRIVTTSAPRPSETAQLVGYIDKLIKQP